MAQMGFELTGVDKVIANLNRMNSYIKATAKTGLIHASNKLRDDSIQYLEQTSEWPPSVDDKSIRNKESWVTEDVSWNAIKLKCISEHAMAVECGTWNSPKLRAGKFHADELTDNGVPFPVGKNQGILVRFAGAIRPQPPKPYLRISMSNPSTLEGMIKEVGQVLKQSIAGALL